MSLNLLMRGASHNSGGGFSTEFFNALVLDGTQRVNLGNDISLQITGSQTVSFWVKPAATGNEEHIISKYQFTGDERAWSIRTDGVGNKWRFIVSETGGATTDVVSIASVTTNWTHFIAIYDGATIAIYIDGAFDNSFTYSSGIHNSTASVIVGSLGGSDIGVLPFSGAIHSVDIFPIALDPNQRFELYNTGKGLINDNMSAALKTEAVLLLPLHDGDDSYVDGSSEGNDGTPFNSPVFTETFEFIT